MPVWLGTAWLHGTKVSHPAELSRACCFGDSSIFSMVKLGCLDVLGVSCCRNVSFPIILCSRKNWVSSTRRGGEAEVGCPGGTCWAFPGVDKGLDGWWSSDVLSCVKHTPHGLCCVGLLCGSFLPVFRNKFPKFWFNTHSWGGSTVIWGLCGFYFIVGYPEGMRSWAHLRILQFALGYIWSCKVMSFWGPAS